MFQWFNQKATNIVTIITRNEPIFKTPLRNSRFTCWPYLDVMIVSVISDLTFSFGKATVGTSHSKKSHNCFHPCFTLYTSSLSAGTMDFTRWLWIRYRFLITQVDLVLQDPQIASRKESKTYSIFLAVGDNMDTGLNRKAYNESNWRTRLSIHGSSSLTLKITLQSGKPSRISSKKKSPGISMHTSAFW